MGTRAIYNIKQNTSEETEQGFNVQLELDLYCHMDNDLPSAAVRFHKMAIQSTKTRGAIQAFIAGNLESEILSKTETARFDIAYSYKLDTDSMELKAYKHTDDGQAELVFYGKLWEFCAHYLPQAEWYCESKRNDAVSWFKATEQAPITLTTIQGLIELARASADKAQEYSNLYGASNVNAVRELKNAERMLTISRIVPDQLSEWASVAADFVNDYY